MIGTFYVTDYTAKLSDKDRAILGKYIDDFVIDEKPSVMTVNHLCGKVHRLYHRDNGTFFRCRGEEWEYQYARRRISITPDPSPVITPIPTPERPTVYIIPQKRFKPVNLFGNNA